MCREMLISHAVDPSWISKVLKYTIICMRDLAAKDKRILFSSLVSASPKQTLHVEAKKRKLSWGTTGKSVSGTKSVISSLG